MKSGKTEPNWWSLIPSSLIIHTTPVCCVLLWHGNEDVEAPTFDLSFWKLASLIKRSHILCNALPLVTFITKLNLPFSPLQALMLASDSPVMGERLRSFHSIPQLLCRGLLWLVIRVLQCLAVQCMFAFNCSAFSCLFLAACPLQFPEILRDSLEVLYLSENQLECVPSSVCTLKTLSELYLSKWVKDCSFESWEM